MHRRVFDIDRRGNVDRFCRHRFDFFLRFLGIDHWCKDRHRQDKDRGEAPLQSLARFSDCAKFSNDHD